MTKRRVRNPLDAQYIELLKDILENGTKKADRTGTGTVSVFGREIRHNMADGFPLLTTKKMHFKSIVTELIWFLRGETNIRYLLENKCNIWNGDAYKNYKTKSFKEVREDKKRMLEGGWENVSIEPNILTLPEFIEKIKSDDAFAEKWGDLGPIYGSQWRSVTILGDPTDNGNGSHTAKVIEIDQIRNLIDDLKNNPDSRRLMVNAWNVAEIDHMVLPPCHYGFQLYSRELSYEERYDLWFETNYETGMEHNYDIVPSFLNHYDSNPTPTRALSLKWTQRSVDTFLGLPFNIASYGLLLEILADATGMVADELIGSLGDTHLYLNHIEAATEQIKRVGHALPSLEFNTEFWNPENILGEHFVDGIPSIEPDDFEIIRYLSNDKIIVELSN